MILQIQTKASCFVFLKYSASAPYCFCFDVSNPSESIDIDSFGIVTSFVWSYLRVFVCLLVCFLQTVSYMQFLYPTNVLGRRNTIDSTSSFSQSRNASHRSLILARANSHQSSLDTGESASYFLTYFCPEILNITLRSFGGGGVHVKLALIMYVRS